MNQKGFAPIIVILGIVLTGIIGVGAYLIFNQCKGMALFEALAVAQNSPCSKSGYIFPFAECNDFSNVWRVHTRSKGKDCALDCVVDITTKQAQEGWMCLGALPSSENTPPIITPTPKIDETANWKTYTNSKYGFSIKYPLKTNNSFENWQYEEFRSETSFGVGFGTPSSKSGGYIWNIWITENGNIENLIKQVGNQFTDRKEKRENIQINSMPALLVTVTTEQVKEWLSKNVYIQKDNKIYSIDGDGSSEFELFYNTFKFN